jgi:hypothetical protein
MAGWRTLRTLRGNPAGKADRYHSPHLTQFKVKMQKAVRALLSGHLWRGSSADAFCRCSSRKGGPLYPKEEYVNVRL